MTTCGRWACGGSRAAPGTCAAATGPSRRCPESATPPTCRSTGDWDGNGRANLGLYRWSDHTFYLRSDNGTYTAVHMGIAGSRPIVGDWNGDGKDDLGVQSPGGKYTMLVSNGTSNSWTSLGYGYSTDIPFSGDWNHDGKSDIGVWRPSTAQFILRSATTLTGRYANQVTTWGARR